MGMSTSKTEANLICNTNYTRYIWAYNSCGNSTATTLMQSTSTCSFSIGMSYCGGIIFYIDGTGQHGLISSTSDQSTGAQWGCYGTTIGGTSTAIGTGQSNTTRIINGCNTAGIAARICDDLVLNGYDDWFLPSRDELNLMYLQRTVVGGFADHIYWSSSEYDANNAWDQWFYGGSQYNRTKSNTLYVRAIRAF